jgi:hypothetical protein
VCWEEVHLAPPGAVAELGALGVATCVLQMKARLIEYLMANLHRAEVRERLQWQRVRRLGRRWFITLFVIGMWLFLVAFGLLGVLSVFPSLDFLHRILLRFPYRRALVVVPLGSIGYYFLAAYVWRKNERKYSGSRSA